MSRKLIVILGPTASGKSELAVKLAKRFNGEIISADSRQVYKGMDIGTGKVPRDRDNSAEYLYRGIPHHLLDVASPKRRFTVVQYRKLALKMINKIQKNGHVPILSGGSGFYIQAVVDGITIPEVPPNWKLRKKLEKKSVKELYQILRKLDPCRTKTIEKENPRRLIRAIEIGKKIGRVPISKKKPLPYPVLMLGIKKEKKELSSLIKRRLLKRLRKVRKGIIAEVKKLKNSGLSWKRLEEFGLEYRFIAQYFQKKIKYAEMVNLIQKESEQFAKRQITWFKRDKRIIWIKTQREAEGLVRDFLKK
jgi:tRNA dimethylallyltransferase